MAGFAAGSPTLRPSALPPEGFFTTSAELVATLPIMPGILVAVFLALPRKKMLPFAPRAVEATPKSRASITERPTITAAASSTIHTLRLTALVMTFSFRVPASSDTIAPQRLLTVTEDDSPNIRWTSEDPALHETRRTAGTLPARHLRRSSSSSMTRLLVHSLAWDAGVPFLTGDTNREPLTVRVSARLGGETEVEVTLGQE